MKEVRQECGMEETSSEEEDLAGQCITEHFVVVSHCMPQQPKSEWISVCTSSGFQCLPRGPGSSCLSRPAPSPPQSPLCPAWYTPSPPNLC